MKAARVRVQARRVSSVLKDLDAGRFAIPRLQREFVWNGPKAAKLLDSIYRGMPIGAVLIWQAAKSQRLHLRQRFHILPAFNQKNPNVWFLVDGQQRLSVLHHVREGDRLQNARRQDLDFARVVFSLENEEDGQQIRYRRPIEGEYVSLGGLLHPHWRHKLRSLGARKLERVRKCREAILRYRVFQMFVEGDLAAIRETFLRINTQGMKVTTADAVFTQAENLELRDVAHAIREHLDAHFKDMETQPLLFLLAATQGASEASGRAVQATIAKLNREADHDGRKKKVLAKTWNRLGPCVAKAANYLRERFSVVHRSFLASDYMLSMLAYFFFLNGRGPNRRQADEIRKWFWATSVGSRYSGREFNRRIGEDLKFFRALSRGSRKRFRYVPQVELSDLRKAQYASRSALTSAVYCMLLSRGPVYLLDKGLNEIPVQEYAGRAERKDRHHIFPRGVLMRAELPASQYNSIVNICLLVAAENQEIGSRRPSSYLDDLDQPGWSFARKMSRHLIPIDGDSGVWDNNTKRGFNRFMLRRTELLSRELEGEAGIRLFRRPGN